MSYTTLRVADAGIVLFEAHRARLGEAHCAAFDAFAQAAAPGVYSLRGLANGQLQITERDGSRLYDGIGVRWVPSPIASLTGPRPKQASPSPWDAVREVGVASLLTSRDETELFEACTAAVLAWNGAMLVAVPPQTPRVASITEAYLLARHPHRREVLRVEADWPLVLVNAVVGVCRPAVSRPDFPPDVVGALLASLAQSARR